MERSTADTKKKVLSSHFVESSRPSLTTVCLEINQVRLNRFCDQMSPRLLEDPRKLVVIWKNFSETFLKNAF